jgi:hypothetical protein
MSQWFKKRFEDVVWTDVFNQVERDFLALGGPVDMLLIEQSYAPLDSTLFLRVPVADVATAYPGFVPVDGNDLPKKATLLIGYNEEFEKLFEYGQDRN